MELSRAITQHLPKRERYMVYFESLRSSMKRHGWRSLYSSGTNWCRFLPESVAREFGLGVPVFSYSARFPNGDVEIAAILRIRKDRELFDDLHELKGEIETDFGGALDWSQRLNNKPAKRIGRQIFTSYHGSIFAAESELQEFGDWHIDTLLRLDDVFTPRIRQLKTRS